MGRPKAPRCIDCTKILRKGNTASNYKGDLCKLCADIRTINNKKRWENKAGGRRTALETAIVKVIKGYGLTTEIKNAIGLKLRTRNILGHFEDSIMATARREARRATYGLLLSLGAKSFFGEKKDGRKAIRSKMLIEIEEALGDLGDRR